MEAVPEDFDPTATQALPRPAFSEAGMWLK
jgi:hypothetical protein